MARSLGLDELFNASVPLRSSAVSALSGLEPEERREFVMRAAAAPATRRLALASRMAELSEDDATLDFSGVLTAFLHDEDAAVRRAAIEGLWECEERELIAPLIELMRDDGDTEVRSAAALSLGRFVVLNEFDALRRTDSDAVLHALRDLSGDPTEPTQLRARALESLGASSEEWVTPLIWQGYDDDDRRMQVGALHAMGRSCDPQWLPTLYEEMQSPDPERRFEAATATGLIGDEEAIAPLAELIQDADAEVQEAAISSLGMIGGEVAVEVLQAHLEGANERLTDAVRAAIAEAQGGLMFEGDEDLLDSELLDGEGELGDLIEDGG